MKKVFGKLSNERGVGTVEAVIIVAILVALALMFRQYIIHFVELIFETIFKDAKDIVSSPDIELPGKLG